MTGKRGVWRVLGIAGILLIAGCTAQREGVVTFLHTNDMHCQFTPFPATWIDSEPRPLIGGVVALDEQIRRAREAYPHSLLLDAGDILTGTPLSKISVAGAKGGGFVEMMNLMGYDAMTIGNHEFDEGQENLMRLIELADFDVLSANLLVQDKHLAPQGEKIYRVGDFRIGVVGLALSALDQVTAIKNLKGVTVLDPITTAQAAIDRLDRKTDLIVLLAHQGYELDQELAQQIRGADLIIGGHSHTRLTGAVEKNGVLIVQAGSKTSNLGRLTCRVANDSIIDYEYELIPTWVDSVIKPSAELLKQVTQYERQIQDEYGKVIGTLETDWVRTSHAESNIGNFITDAMREATQADFAVINSGGIRKDLVAGPITKLDVNEILPFSNYLVTFSCSGDELLELLATTARAAAFRESSMLQVSGIECVFRKLSDGEVELLRTRAGGRPIDPHAVYRGVTVDFVLFGQSKNYFGFEPNNHQETGVLLADAVVDYIVRQTPIRSLIEGRMRRQ
ncbi:bifunctional metallophosphatase/5'-nucleotidase [candidate division KSB1 bacterium]|nr:bifunctional metallophosphatase/5'-nucleotidase [candidate division KSB1 bacterium]